MPSLFHKGPWNNGAAQYWWWCIGEQMPHDDDQFHTTQMLSALLSAATLVMNRGEQETLYRQSHDFRFQQAEAKALHDQYPYASPCLNQAQQRHKHGKQRHRGFSHGNIHQIVSNLHSPAVNARSFGEERPLTACDDLVLSVLKSPIQLPPPILPTHTSTCIPLRQLNIPPTPSSTHSSVPSQCTYQALQGSEDELVDDIESAKETTKLDGFDHAASNTGGSSSGGFQFLRRFRPGKSPKFEAHHRRVPTPIRRKSSNQSRVDILNGVATGKLWEFWSIYHATYWNLKYQWEFSFKKNWVNWS